MKVILLLQVRNIGNKYEIKNVSDGYAMNFLFPKKLAEIATDAAVKRLMGKKAAADGEQKIHEDLLMKNLKDLEGVRIEMMESANDKGHLFAGIHAAEIVPVLMEQTRLQILPEYINLEKPIKTSGEHVIEVRVQNVKVTFTLVVLAK